FIIVPVFPSCPVLLISQRAWLSIISAPVACGCRNGLLLGVCTNREDGMASKRGTASGSQSQGVTAERAARLYRLLRLLAAGPQKRNTLTKRLRLDVRGFYRDLELLDRAGIVISLAQHRYTLKGNARDAIAPLPFPDPRFPL